jgi:hypothetical protein
MHPRAVLDPGLRVGALLAVVTLGSGVIGATLEGLPPAQGAHGASKYIWAIRHFPSDAEEYAKQIRAYLLYPAEPTAPPIPFDPNGVELIAFEKGAEVIGDPAHARIRRCVHIQVTTF